MFNFHTEQYNFYAPRTLLIDEVLLLIFDVQIPESCSELKPHWEKLVRDEPKSKDFEKYFMESWQLFWSGNQMRAGIASGQLWVSFNEFWV